MEIRKYNRPLLFYGLSIFIPWILWFVAAYLSNQSANIERNIVIGSFLGVVGLASPLAVAFCMIFTNKDLRLDFVQRFFNIRKSNSIYIVLSIVLMPASIIIAQLFSLLFGHDLSQFQIKTTESFSAGLFPAWFILILAPLLEEFAWHTYGTDSLRNRFNLFIVCMIFGFFWVFWHFPLSFIKGYYQNTVAETNIIYSINYSVSLVPFVFLLNWIYYKSNRNILTAIVFHITANVFNELFSTHPDSKVIQTILLLILTIVIVIKNKKLFFMREYLED